MFFFIRSEEGGETATTTTMLAHQYTSYETFLRALPDVLAFDVSKGDRRLALSGVTLHPAELSGVQASRGDLLFRVHATATFTDGETVTSRVVDYMGLPAMVGSSMAPTELSLWEVRRHSLMRFLASQAWRRVMWPPPM